MELYNLLKQFRDSENPELRLAYLNSLKQLLEMGKRLHNLQLNEEEIKEDLQKLQKLIDEYKVYPLVQRPEPEFKDTFKKDKQDFEGMFGEETYQERSF